MQYSEKDLEDWVCRNIGDVVGGLGETELVGRQIELPAVGRLDVLALTHWFNPWVHYAGNSDGGGERHLYTVIEVKRDTINEDAVAQALRYAGCLSRGAGNLASEFPGSAVQVDAIVAAPQLTPRGAMAVRASDAVKFVRLTPTIAVECDHWLTPTATAVESAIDLLSETLRDPIEAYLQNGGMDRKRMSSATYVICKLIEIGRPVRPLGHRGFVPHPDSTDAELMVLEEYEAEVNAVLRYSWQEPEFLDLMPRAIGSGQSE